MIVSEVKKMNPSNRVLGYADDKDANDEKLNRGDGR
ncbi:MAG: hypothetical protein A4E32_01480 [Methanomassiliicoccales archaeon PtaU1.Bin124]|nr:MAG: hypothetical protein A4E32_01480 [Methanomassiliicoccales archaeon PtaU1.Bin124]